MLSKKQVFSFNMSANRSAALQDSFDFQFIQPKIFLITHRRWNCVTFGMWKMLPGPFCHEFMRRRLSQIDCASWLHNLLCEESEKSLLGLLVGFGKTKNWVYQAKVKVYVASLEDAGIKITLNSSSLTRLMHLNYESEKNSPIHECYDFTGRHRWMCIK